MFFALDDAALVRSFAKKVAVSYTATVDAKGKDGDTHLDFEIDLLTPKIDKAAEEQGKHPTMTCFMKNGRGHVGELAAKLPVVATTEWDILPTGVPEVNLGGQAGAEMMAMLSLFIPNRAKPASSFEMSGVRLANGASLNGRGFASRPVDGAQKISWNADLMVGDNAVGKVSVVATFELLRGSLVCADGKFTAPDGTITFHLLAKQVAKAP